jgi:hypothetical protein
MANTIWLRTTFGVIMGPVEECSASAALNYA